MRGTVTVPGRDVVRLVLEGLARDRGNLRAEGREVEADLRALKEAGHVSVRALSHEFALEFEFDATEEEYGEATGQQRCADCRRWSAFCKQYWHGPVCDFCRAGQCSSQ